MADSARTVAPRHGRMRFFLILGPTRNSQPSIIPAGAPLPATFLRCGRGAYGNRVGPLAILVDSRRFHSVIMKLIKITLPHLAGTGRSCGRVELGRGSGSDKAEKDKWSVCLRGVKCCRASSTDDRRMVWTSQPAELTAGTEVLLPSREREREREALGDHSKMKNFWVRRD